MRFCLFRLATPRIIFRANAVDFERLLDLRNMRHAKSLEGVTIPCVEDGCAKMVLPILSILELLCGKSEVEQGEEVDELKNAAC